MIKVCQVFSVMNQKLSMSLGQRTAGKNYLTCGNAHDHLELVQECNRRLRIIGRKRVMGTADSRLCQPLFQKALSEQSGSLLSSG